MGSARNAKPALAIAGSCDGRMDALIPGGAWYITYQPSSPTWSGAVNHAL